MSYVDAFYDKNKDIVKVVERVDGKRIFVPVEDKKDYVQNEEQSDTTTWKKIKSKTTTEEDYHLRMEQRIEDLMAKIDAGEIKLEDLTPEDRQVIIGIRNQNKV